MNITFRQYFNPVHYTSFFTQGFGRRFAIGLVAGVSMGMAAAALTPQEESNKMNVSTNLMPRASKGYFVVCQSGSDHNGSLAHYARRIQADLNQAERVLGLTPVLMQDVSKEEMLKSIHDMSKTGKKIRVLILNAHGSMFRMDFPSKEQEKQTKAAMYLNGILCVLFSATIFSAATNFSLIMGAAYFSSTFLYFYLALTPGLTIEPPLFPSKLKNTIQTLPRGATLILASCSTGYKIPGLPCLAERISLYNPGITVVASNNYTSSSDLGFEPHPLACFDCKYGNRSPIKLRGESGDVTQCYRNGEQIPPHMIPPYIVSERVIEHNRSRVRI